MLFGEIIAVYCGNHTERINGLHRANVEFCDVKIDGSVHVLYDILQCKNMDIADCCGIISNVK